MKTDTLMVLLFLCHSSIIITTKEPPASLRRLVRRTTNGTAPTLMSNPILTHRGLVLTFGCERATSQHETIMSLPICSIFHPALGIRRLNRKALATMPTISTTSSHYASPSLRIRLRLHPAGGRASMLGRHRPPHLPGTRPEHSPLPALQNSQSTQRSWNMSIALGNGVIASR